MAPERVCYVHCNFCNTILAVGVPLTSMFSSANVTCGYCSNLLSVNVRPWFQSQPSLQHHLQKGQLSFEEGKDGVSTRTGTSYKCNDLLVQDKSGTAAMVPSPIPPPEKRQRLPSAYNRFIREEIRRIKASNPGITHRDAFTAASKNWAHLPHFQCGVKLDGSKQAKS
ncbi:hypothetical protein NMG60_11015522 [Bertholletia excelsa]